MDIKYSARETVAYRRSLYRLGVRVHGVAGVSAELLPRDITADSFRLSPAPLERLRPWLRRELTVLYGVHTSLVDVEQRIVTARLQRHGLEDQNTIEEELRPFLLARTNHFLHEMVSFASSPLALESYDLEAVYEPPDDAIVQLNDDRSCLSLAAWDDETPGPSYSLSPANQEAAGKDEEGEECLIVGYKKPNAERTPEQLTSDSEEEKKKVAPPLPQSPTIPPSVTGCNKDGGSWSRETGNRRRRGGRRAALYLTQIVLFFPP
ncbi:hypothetical protein JOQ06_023482 [Pogonophryne albipinna]|uniref:RING-type E3 ubiquitin transferase n=1 Tax=Pogonophryne albipinna TaxID=1090488 RepID=A0AAD6BIM9_9TELE|nr:hypothetical protein JOQ06_023482 [Pogonophryne albipinna]